MKSIQKKDYTIKIYRLLQENTTQNLESEKQPNRAFLHEALTSTVIKNCKASTSDKFKIKFRFSVNDVINTKEQVVFGAIKDAFEGENMQT